MISNNVLNACILYSFSITSKNGETTDLSLVFNNIEIYEDIFTHHLNALVSLKDTADMPKTFPIIGGEYVQIAFTDNESNSARFFDFIVAEILPQAQISHETAKNTFLMLKLVSIDEVAGNLVRSSYKFSPDSFTEASSYNDIILHYLSLMKSKATFKQSKTSEMIKPFVANYWNFDELLDYICSQSVDSLFFQTSDGYRFDRLSTLVKQAPAQELYMLKNLESRVGLNTVLAYHFDKYFNIMKMFATGGFGKTVFDIQPESYEFSKLTTTLDSIYGEYPMMGKNKIFQPSLSTQDNDVVFNVNDAQSNLKRNMILQTMQNYNLIVQMNGSVNRRVGDVVLFNVPSSNNSIINENFQHSWLILQIKHTITNTMSYKQNMRLFKNAFFNNAKVG